MANMLHVSGAEDFDLPDWMTVSEDDGGEP
jgi:hypothetical protein